MPFSLFAKMTRRGSVQEKATLHPSCILSQILLNKLLQALLVRNHSWLDKLQQAHDVSMSLLISLCLQLALYTVRVAGSLMSFNVVRGVVRSLSPIGLVVDLGKILLHLDNVGVLERVLGSVAKFFNHSEFAHEVVDFGLGGFGLVLSGMKHGLEIFLLVYPVDVFVFKVLSSIVGGGIFRDTALLRGLVGDLGNLGHVDDLGNVGDLDGLASTLLNRRSRDLGKETHVEIWVKIMIRKGKKGKKGKKSEGSKKSKS